MKLTTDEKYRLQIWKFPVNSVDSFSVLIPKGAKILAVQEQSGTPQMWAVVDPTAETETRVFRLAGTGQPLGIDPSHYIGTFQVYGGQLVFHLFEIMKEDPNEQATQTSE